LDAAQIDAISLMRASLSVPEGQIHSADPISTLNSSRVTPAPSKSPSHLAFGSIAQQAISGSLSPHADSTRTAEVISPESIRIVRITTPR
jgi:hypothetical protein